VRFDTLLGGLKPYKKGGGNETNSLRFRSAEGKEYVIRSINKSRIQVIPSFLRKTAIGTIIQDGVSMSYPYAAVAIAGMESQVGIYHTNPCLVYVPMQKALDTFNVLFANEVYLLEERPDGDWTDAPNLGSFNKFFSTVEVIEKLQENNLYKVDQMAFIKARLFDLLIGDWDKHADNWRWGLLENERMFMPIPRDRDQAFFTRNGILNNFFIWIGGLNFMQNFGYSIKSVAKLTSQDRKLDKFFTNQMVLADWINTAKRLQLLLTDSVIRQSISRLPPEVFAVSGQEIIEKIKSRRDKLHNYAEDFYYLMAKEVSVYGSKQKEYFEIKKLREGETSVSIFRIDYQGNKEDSPFYERVFIDGDTRQISIDGLGGNDLIDITPGLKNIRVNKEKG